MFRLCVSEEHEIACLSKFSMQLEEICSKPLGCNETDHLKCEHATVALRTDELQTNHDIFKKKADEMDTELLGTLFSVISWENFPAQIPAALTNSGVE